ncbi:MAG: hypothetical protein KDA41_18010, partial [Planctomycetales bacterium]|nr:hypothetical protein [Planctomycetales bacterium]
MNAPSVDAGQTPAGIDDLIANSPSAERIYSDRRAAERESSDRRERRRVGEENSAPEVLEAFLNAGAEVAQPEGNVSHGYRIAKRALDIVGSAALIVALSPILAATFVV